MKTKVYCLAGTDNTLDKIQAYIKYLSSESYIGRRFMIGKDNGPITVADQFVTESGKIYVQTSSGTAYLAESCDFIIE